VILCASEAYKREYLEALNITFALYNPEFFKGSLDDVLANTTLNKVWNNVTYGIIDYGFKGDFFRDSDGAYTANAKIAKVSFHAYVPSYCLLKLCFFIFT
jgi:hypothetical protein